MTVFICVVLATSDVAGAVFGLLACVAVLVGIVAAFSARILYATKITKDETRLGGCGKAFLDRLDGH